MPHLHLRQVQVLRDPHFGAKQCPHHRRLLRRDFDASRLNPPRNDMLICYNYDMDKVKIRIPKAKIAEFCKRWNISEFAIFGSALRGDFRPDSDVDVLVSFAPQAKVSLFDMVHMQDELKSIFGREVDLISKRGVENSRNYLRRKMILESAEVIHVA